MNGLGFSDPLLAHLLDILADPASDGLILAGGFGLRQKQEYLRQNGARTLIADLPAARATQDLDFFLRLELWTDTDKGATLHALLDRLHYRERVPHRKFEKPLDPEATQEAPPDRQSAVFCTNPCRRPFPADQ